MNANAKAWVEALRSGKYKQTRGYLRAAEERYCCLGVACELAVKAGVIGAPTRSESGSHYTYPDSIMERWGTLPATVQKWLGLATSKGDFQAEGGPFTSLASQNDRGSTFDEIASIIESEPKGLFVE